MSRLKLEIEKQAVKFLSSLPLKHFKQVQIAVYELMSNPTPNDSKPLKGPGFAGLWRKDVGEYRVVYRYDTETLRVIVVGNRNDGAVYKDVERLV